MEWSIVKEDLKHGSDYLIYTKNLEYIVTKFFDSEPESEDVFYTMPGFYYYNDVLNGWYFYSLDVLAWTQIISPLLKEENESNEDFYSYSEATILGKSNPEDQYLWTIGPYDGHDFSGNTIDVLADNHEEVIDFVKRTFIDESKDFIAIDKINKCIGEADSNDYLEFFIEDKYMGIYLVLAIKN